MATKVALTAEEFRENSQRSIALFNTEKLSTNSTHVLKSAYCNSVHFCRCNLHGACGGKGRYSLQALLSFGLQSARSVWRQSGAFVPCGRPPRLQSARSVWRQRKTQKSFALTRWVAICTERVEAKYRGQRKAARRTRCNLHGACGGKASRRRSDRGCYARCNLHGACGGKALYRSAVSSGENVAICTERVEAKVSLALSSAGVVVAICTERVEAKGQSFAYDANKNVAICTERVEAKRCLCGC